MKKYAWLNKNGEICLHKDIVKRVENAPSLLYYIEPLSQDEVEAEIKMFKKNIYNALTKKLRYDTDNFFEQVHTKKQLLFR